MAKYSDLEKKLLWEKEFEKQIAAAYRKGCEDTKSYWEDEVGKARTSAIREFSEKLEPYIQHDRDCILSRYEAGRPTPDGGYENKIAGKWYQSRPVDETPKCDCGLAEILRLAHEAEK